MRPTTRSRPSTCAVEFSRVHCHEVQGSECRCTQEWRCCDGYISRRTAPSYLRVSYAYTPPAGKKISESCTVGNTYCRRSFRSIVVHQLITDHPRSEKYYIPEALSYPSCVPRPFPNVHQLHTNFIVNRHNSISITSGEATQFI